MKRLRSRPPRGRMELRCYIRPRQPDPSDQGGDDVRHRPMRVTNDYVAKRGRYAPKEAA